MMALLVSSLVWAAGDCHVQKIRWTGERSDADEMQLDAAVGVPCDGWRPIAQKLERYYEDRGFLAATVKGSVDSLGTLSVELQRGAAWVWAGAENLDSAKTDADVFRKLTGLEVGSYASPLDLERADRKLSRMGYYERTAPARMFRDPGRNRIVPVFSMRAAAVSEAEALLIYSSEDNVWEGHVNVNLYNILGTARDLQLEGFTGEDSRRLHGMYKEPWIFGSPWNVVARGNFDEETLITADGERDSAEAEYIERLVVGEIGITREIGFDLTLGVFLGMSEDDKHSSFEMSYVSLDRFALPRSGWNLKGSLTYKMDRPDSLDNYLMVSANVIRYMPVYKNFIARFSGAAGSIFSTDAALKRTDLFALGGMNSFKGVEYQMVRTRAYGYSELALMWQDGYDLSIEGFYMPGLYRPATNHGWTREQDYGLAFTQYRKNWSVNFYYALRNGESYLDGIVGVGVKTLF